MKLSTSLSLVFLLLVSLPLGAQVRDKKLTIQVTSVEGDNLSGQELVLKQTDYQVSYGTLKLDAEGTCRLNVYAGHHNLSIERDGFTTVSYDFEVKAEESEKTVSLTLSEKTRKPYALTATVCHNVYEGTDDIALSWNTEAPVLFDDFESYSPFSVSFGEWTGIDADNEAAAPLVGSYPNRGVMQYAQIINPLAVDPVWWYDYPILRPYSGQQYVGFTRTNSGNANDDWLISPVITPGTDNVLSFMGKAADQFPERFMVYVTTKTTQPTQDDFVRIDPDNYETADYRGWRQYSYDLSAYAGQPIKFAIRYISHYNRYGSFMLMVDDVYVGQRQYESRLRSSARMAKRSAANPNERFQIFLDGELVETTDAYSTIIPHVKGGTHTIGVQAVYMQAESEVTTVQVDVPTDAYAHVVFHITADSRLTADGQKLSLVNMSTSEVYEQTVANSEAEFLSLPKGTYLFHVDEGAFDYYQQTAVIENDTTIDIVLSDHILAPYNITLTPADDGSYVLRWNQELSFYDSFEDYDDFATGTFGQWTTVDADQTPVYPIALGGITNIVTFPGSGTATKPTAIPPMVFNPWNTSPAMLPTDAAIAAPTGQKTIIFFSSQQAKSDKWLISPLFDIHDNYVLSVKAKAYEAMYPESIEFCISTGGDQPSDFSAISKVDAVSAGMWTLYETDLSSFAGETVRLAVHYTSYDAFLTQIDDFTVGPKDGQGALIDYGNVVRFEILLDGEKIGESSQPVFTIPSLTEGSHVVGIKAIYQNGASDVVSYAYNVSSGIRRLRLDPSAPMTVYSLSGICLGSSLHHLPAGVYLVRQNGLTVKIKK